MQAALLASRSIGLLPVRHFVRTCKTSWKRQASARPVLLVRAVHNSVDQSVRSQQASASNRLQRLFYDNRLPKSVGATFQLDPEESKHAARVLRLTTGTDVELCNGLGELVTGRITGTDKSAVSVTTSSAVQQVPWQGCKWEVAVACGSLQGSRADWLVEKCTELGAWSLRPITTERSHGVGWKGMQKATSKASANNASSRYNRWQRVAQAASKQSLRLHKLVLEPTTSFNDFISVVKTADIAMVGAAGGKPVQSVLPRDVNHGVMMVGPEGDFTMKELEMLTSSGARLVSLGNNRLRVETAAIAMLSIAQVLA